MRLFKNKDATNPSNYRGINLLCTMAKISEKVLCNYLEQFISHGHLLTPKQYGFQANSSTTYNVLDTYDYITSNMDVENAIDDIYVDLAR